MHKLAHLITATNRGLSNLIAWLALAMVVITLGVVMLRYLFDMGTIVMQESVMYLHGLLFLLGIPAGLITNSHVRVDIMYARMSPRRQNLVNVAGHLLFLLPVGVFILLTSLPYVAASWQVLEGSAEVGGIPAIFLLKSLIPVMAVLLILQGVADIVQRLMKDHS
ncbi:MAG: TRAP transporter small permease subunit [Pseudomonadota bacterium]